jgi:formate hydrogenlyase transcriptional activator
MIGTSAALGRVREQIAQVGLTDATVLIQGETGTGKELVARAIHQESARRDRPMIKVNCAALPRELVESELFGHEKGAFTGAVQQRRGRFELADGGTLFLDEIGEMPLEAQAKLLRVLQEGELERVGGTRALKVDARVIAATNRDLLAEVGAGRFRADLYYRLNVFPIALPPLRARREDIPDLVRQVAARVARRLGRPLAGIASGFIEHACRYDWPGNVRELENVVERAVIVSSGGLLDSPESFPSASRSGEPGALAAANETMEEVEREHLLRTLDSTRWKISGSDGAAARLGLNPSTLRGRMRKLGIRKPG